MKSRRTLRTVYALGLLGVLAMQWVAGGIYLKRSLLVETVLEMDDTEKSIANQVWQEYGFHSQVALVDEDQVELLHGLGYGAPFVHNIEIDGHARLFTLAEQSIQYQAIEVDFTPRNHQPDEALLLNIQRLFSQFCVGEHTLLESISSPYRQDNFHVNRWHDLFIHSTQAPPPRWV